LLRHLKQAGAETDVSTLGDPSLLENQFADVEAAEVAKQFGEKFARALNDLLVGEWQGCCLTPTQGPSTSLWRRPLSERR
jgi:hypothetical protein